MNLTTVVSQCVVFIVFILLLLSSQSDIAREIGLTPPSIIDLTSGRQKSVKWEIGTRLLALHNKVLAPV
jgi:hypothetical protein